MHQQHVITHCAIASNKLSAVGSLSNPTLKLARLHKYEQLYQPLRSYSEHLNLCSHLLLALLVCFLSELSTHTKTRVTCEDRTQCCRASLLLSAGDNPGSDTVWLSSSLARLKPDRIETMSQADIIKSLKVKTAGVKRTHKELSMYEKEREKEQAKVDKLKAGGAEEHDIKQAVSGVRL